MVEDIRLLHFGSRWEEKLMLETYLWASWLWKLWVIAGIPLTIIIIKKVRSRWKYLFIAISLGGLFWMVLFNLVYYLD